MPAKIKKITFIIPLIIVIAFGILYASRRGPETYINPNSTSSATTTAATNPAPTTPNTLPDDTPAGFRDGENEMVLKGYVVDKKECPPCPQEGLCAPCPEEYFLFEETQQEQKYTQPIFIQKSLGNIVSKLKTGVYYEITVVKIRNYDSNELSYKYYLKYYQAVPSEE